jgi:hypothetical protein
MNTSDITQQIINSAMQLPPEQRAVIADALEDSLPLADVSHGPEAPAEQVAVAWKQEIRRRIEESDCGDVPSAPLDEAWPRIAGNHG